MVDAVTSALCVIIPDEFQGSVNAIRQYADKAHPRWMPHINLIYPFLTEYTLDQSNYLDTLKTKLQQLEPFDVTIDELGSFSQGGGLTFHLAPTEGVAPMQRLYETVKGCYPLQRKLRAQFSPHLTLAQFPLPQKDGGNGAFAKANSSAQMHKALAHKNMSISFTVAEVAYITREGFDNPFEVRKRIKIGTLNARSGSASSLSIRHRVPRPLISKRKDMSIVLDTMVTPVAVRMTLSWMKRMNPAKLPKTVPALCNAINTFCRIKLKLNVEEVLDQLIRLRVVKRDFMKKAFYVDAPTGIGRGRGRARGRGRGAAPAPQPKVKTIRTLQAVHVLKVSKSEPGPQPLTFDDSEGLERRIRFFLYKLVSSGGKGKHLLPGFKSQLQDVATCTATVPALAVMNECVRQKVIRVGADEHVRYYL